ncbi:hypothetical protein E2C01_091784 [Portunus trituberculatus]|uniref:Uncharacterized protein n=1 Tax=Portunus trituberculatus TaxID=210409 RepID=A0A5B7JIG1_PORTR|nr:hypothetical protein [Portunus trituberculatus]
MRRAPSCPPTRPVGGRSPLPPSMTSHTHTLHPNPSTRHTHITHTPQPHRHATYTPRTHTGVVRAVGGGWCGREEGVSRRSGRRPASRVRTARDKWRERNMTNSI